MSQQPLNPQELTRSYKGSVSHTYKFPKGWNEKLNLANSYLHKAAKQIKKWADEKRQPRELIVGDSVLVNLP